MKFPLTGTELDLFLNKIGLKSHIKNIQVPLFCIENAMKPTQTWNHDKSGSHPGLCMVGRPPYPLLQSNFWPVEGK